MPCIWFDYNRKMVRRAFGLSAGTNGGAARAGKCSSTEGTSTEAVRSGAAISAAEPKSSREVFVVDRGCMVGLGVSFTSRQSHVPSESQES